MFNVIVGGSESVSNDRFLEGLDPGLASAVRPDGRPNFACLQEIPTIVFPEIDQDEEQVARVGTVKNLAVHGRSYRFDFDPSPHLSPVPLDELLDAAEAVGLDNWDFHRTRWQVKRGDLYSGLIGRGLLSAVPVQPLHVPPTAAPATPAAPVLSPKVFKLPAGPPTRDSIAVMMPFDRRYDEVYETLKRTAATGGWSCRRVDDMWESDQVIDDVIALIGRSEVVLCDLTGRNANVFYEMGIAHTLGRQVIMITQSPDDVPFDVKAHRFLQYHPNGEGLATLYERLSSRLSTIRAQR